MRIYVGHSSSIRFKEELYKPIRDSELNSQHEFILPHETSDLPQNSKEQMNTIDLMIAEVSASSIGLGIELAWAQEANIPVVAIHKEGTRVSTAVQTITKRIYPYQKETLIETIRQNVE